MDKSTHNETERGASLVREIAAVGITALALTLAGGTLSGCNTTEGVGEDIEATGDAIEDAAEDAN